LTSPYLDKALQAKTRDILYDRFSYDSITKIESGANFSRQIDFMVSRYRRLHLIPFISVDASVDKTKCVHPLQSLISSAGNTCSMNSISQLQIHVGSQALFNQPINMPLLNFLQGTFPLEGKYSMGNEFNIDRPSGRVTYSMFKKCYGVVSIDLDRSADSTADERVAQLIVRFRNTASCAMSYILLLEHQVECTLDAVSGQVVASGAV